MESDEASLVVVSVVFLNRIGNDLHLQYLPATAVLVAVYPDASALHDDHTTRFLKVQRSKVNLRVVLVVNITLELTIPEGHNDLQGGGGESRR